MLGQHGNGWRTLHYFHLLSVRIRGVTRGPIYQLDEPLRAGRHRKVVFDSLGPVAPNCSRSDGSSNFNTA